jgi:hypothetical protein
MTKHYRQWSAKSHSSKNVKIKAYKTIILSVLYGYEIWSLTLMDATIGGWKIS